MQSIVPLAQTEMGFIRRKSLAYKNNVFHNLILWRQTGKSIQQNEIINFESIIFY